MQFLHQMFNVSALLLDDTLKPATQLTNGAINNSETINTLFPVVNLFKCVVTEVVLFLIVAFKTLTFHKVV